MAVLRDVPINDLIEAMASELKNVKDIAPPEWAIFVKTGMHKERPPAREDWWHVRAAAVLKSVENLGPIGVEKLRTKYGGKKNRGHKPERFYKGSGNILRKVLQQLEKAGLVKKEEKSVHKGRIITPAGNKIIKNALAEARKSHSKREAAKQEQDKVDRAVVTEAKKPEVKAPEKPKVETKPVVKAPEAKPKVEDKPKPVEKPSEKKPEAKKEPEKVPTAHELAEKKKNE